MNTDRLETLLWARIDGTIDPEELAQLEAHLAEHPEPREIERQITTIAEDLDSLEKVPPKKCIASRFQSSRKQPPRFAYEFFLILPCRRTAPGLPVTETLY